jgi:hypothetical protein
MQRPANFQLFRPDPIQVGLGISAQENQQQLHWPEAPRAVQLNQFWRARVPVLRELDVNTVPIPNQQRKSTSPHSPGI